MISKETVKTFLLYFCVAGVAVLAVNTYLMIQNQNRMLENQEEEGLPAVMDTNERIKNIEVTVQEILSEKVE